MSPQSILKGLCGSQFAKVLAVPLVTFERIFLKAAGSESFIFLFVTFYWDHISIRFDLKLRLYSEKPSIKSRACVTFICFFIK